MPFSSKPSDLLDPAATLAGRDQPVAISETHVVLGATLAPPYPEGLKTVRFGLGCFWGAERLFWQLPGVFTTAAAYAGGQTVNPTYEEVCSGRTNHTEVVQVVYDPEQTGLPALLKVFWQAHDPTQGMRQGNDRGTQYRSAIYTDTNEQLSLAVASRDAYQTALLEKGFGAITTEIKLDPRFYFAEDYHQQYLHKNPGGYCGLRGTGVACAS